MYFAPWNEDYGFVTLEAFRSGKAVITTPDSGGPAELVEHEANGLVAPPTPEGVAAALDRIAADRGLAERLGDGGPRVGRALHAGRPRSRRSSDERVQSAIRM